MNALAGNDTVDASGLPDNLIGLTVNLGDGQGTTATTTTLRTSTATGVFGQTELLTATVNSLVGTPGGTVAFFDGNTVLAAVPINDAGQATLLVSLGVGNHALTAVFEGSAGFAASTSAVVAATVDQAATATALTTTTALAASAKVVHTGQTVRFTAKVHVTSGASKPTGAVSFLAGDVVVAQVRLNAAGRASFQHRFAAKGRFVIRAVYSGDSNFAGSEQSIIEQISGRRKPLVSIRHELR